MGWDIKTDGSQYITHAAILPLALAGGVFFFFIFTYLGGSWDGTAFFAPW